MKCQQEAEQTAMTIELANRLVGGLASENVRWAESVANFKEQEKTLPGDVLLTTAFVSYVGCFTRKYRDNLMHEKWLPFLKGQSVSQYKTYCVCDIGASDPSTEESLLIGIPYKQQKLTQRGHLLLRRHFLVVDFDAVCAISVYLTLRRKGHFF